MNQRPLIALLVVTTMAMGAGVWWAGRAELSPAASLPRAEVIAAAPQKSDVERAQLELPAEPSKATPNSAVAPAENPRVKVAKTMPEWAQEILRSTPEQWKERQGPLTFEQRTDLKQKIYDYFNAEAAPELERRRLDKEWEFIGPVGADGANSYSGTAEDRLLIYSIVMIPREGVYKIALPREKFPDLYTLKDRADALFSW